MRGRERRKRREEERDGAGLLLESDGSGDAPAREACTVVAREERRARGRGLLPSIQSVDHLGGSSTDGSSGTDGSAQGGLDLGPGGGAVKWGTGQTGGARW